MRCLKVMTLLYFFGSLSMLFAAIDTGYQLIDTEHFKQNYKINVDYSKIDRLFENYPQLYPITPNDTRPSKLRNRNTFRILPLDYLPIWNERRKMYNRIGSIPFVSAFDSHLRELLIRQKTTHADLEEEIAAQVFQLSIDYVIPFVNRTLETNTAAKFLDEIESLNIDAGTYVNAVHKLYLDYLSPL